MYLGFLLFSSHECGEHELKARERKEELEAQAKEHETVLAQLSGMAAVYRGGYSPL